MDIEQSTLIWIARIIFAGIFTFIGYSVWRFMRRERVISVTEHPTYQPPADTELPKEDVILTVIAKPGRFFDHARLFQVMQDLGFHYSEDHVFEYLVPDSDYIAFTVINIRAPYVFSTDPKQMSPTNGLVAIMQLPVADGDHQVDYFHLLLSVLDELHTLLDAELCDYNQKLLNNHQLYDMQRHVEYFEQNYNNTIQYDYQ